MYSVKKWAFLIITSIVFLGMACQNQRSEQGNWQSLFDGKTLNSWRILGGKADYSVQDGVLICAPKLNVGDSYLCTEKSFDNFILELNVKIDAYREKDLLAEYSHSAIMSK